MTDEELIARLREGCSCNIDSAPCMAEEECRDAFAAADRIEALVKERDEAKRLMQARHREMLAADGLMRKHQRRAARLTAALVEHNDLLRSALAIAKREGIEGQIASTNWDAYYNRVAVVLKHHHQTANDAREALKGDDHD